MSVPSPARYPSYETDDCSLPLPKQSAGQNPWNRTQDRETGPSGFGWNAWCWQGSLIRQPNDGDVGRKKCHQHQDPEEEPIVLSLRTPRPRLSPLKGKPYDQQGS